MVRYCGLAWCVLILVSCTGGSTVSLTEAVSFHREDGTLVHVERTATSVAKNNSGNPPEAELTTIEIQPKKDGVVVRSEGSSGIGSFKSLQENSMRLLVGGAIFIFGIMLAILTPVKKTGILVSIAGAGLVILSFLPNLPIVGSLGLYIMIAALVCGGAGLFYALYYMRVQRHANENLVTLMETIKRHELTPEQRERVFNTKKSVVSLNQSKTTKSVVKDVKSGLGLG